MCDYTTIFSIGDVSFTWWIIAAPLLFVVIGAGTLIFPVVLKQRPSGFRTKAMGWFLVGSGLFFFFLFLITFYWDYSNLRSAFQTGRYEVVEGEIKDFGPRTSYGRTFEGFRVGDVEFLYSEYEYTGAFNQSSLGKDGPIRNGLRVRVSYVRDLNTNRAMILKLDTSPPLLPT